MLVTGQQANLFDLGQWAVWVLRWVKIRLDRTSKTIKSNNSYYDELFHVPSKS